MSVLRKWFNARLPVLGTWKRHFRTYYLAKNLNIFYVFGALALVVLANQLVTGLWLSMFYIPQSEKAFASIEYIMRDVHFGWLLRTMHSTGASAFFIVIYMHLFRGLLYGSYQNPRELVWLLGMGLYVVLLAEAFFGYLLPWGQMSYWGAQVITSLLGAIPYLGDSLMMWVRGDYTVSSVTLQRFFSLHSIAVPFLMVLLTYAHVVALHQVGSNNPDGINIRDQVDRFGRPLDGLPFHPYFMVKDLLAVSVFLILFFAVVFFAPDMGGYFLEPNNFVPANPLLTPENIAPLWYLAPFYALLRAIPHHLAGVMCLGLALFLLFLLPWLDQSLVRSMRYKGTWSRIMFYGGVASFVLLGYLGTIPITPCRLWIARGAALVYFAYFLLMPLYTRFEATYPVPDRITQ